MATNPFLREYEKPSSTDEYQKALNLYYNPNAKCPSNPTKEISERTSEDNTLSMKCKDSNWKVDIVLPKRVNLYVEHAESKLKRISAIYEMLYAAQQDNREAFNQGKKKFDSAEKMLNDITALIKKQEEESQKIKQELYNSYNQLLDIYYKRQELYPKLEREGVKNSTVKDLYTVVKNEGYPLSGNRLKAVATQYKLSEAVLGPWLEWLDYVNQYEKLQKEVKAKADELDKFEKKLEEFNKSIMIEEPQVKGSSMVVKKKIKVPKSKIKARKGGDPQDLVVIKLD